MTTCLERKVDLSDFECSIFDDTNYELGEGPTYDPVTDTVWWFDISGRKLIERPFAGGGAKVHNLPFMGSALAVIDAERQLVVTEHGLYVRSTNDGTLSQLMELEADNEVTRSNDSRVHPCGAMWIGTMGKTAQPEVGSIYHFFRGEIRRIFSDITVTNCICFSADGSVGYFTDSTCDEVMRVDVDPETGLPAADAKTFIMKQPDHPGFADGAVMDADGLLWIARWQGSCVQAYNSSGAVAETIALPAWQITCPAFVGRDASQMIVTSASAGLSHEQRAEHPHAGKTFLLNRRMNGRIEPRVII
ncbi:MAG: SMP-30/gluconolactonase/LRE family protein [Hyphomicrobiales bacterium]|nr:SMP-30/gluconolactonase/LRE family protein [Hyphomicrobiales bacterium]MCP5000857.1 SMP-30/gluconolactonase/LRE family protein [Hyphomicrobiales bacterium]